MSKADYPSRQELEAAALRLGVDVDAIAAVAQVERGPQGAFYRDGTPTVLFEAHRFHALTDGRFDDRRVPGCDQPWGVISAPTWNPKGYGPYRVQPLRLNAAASLDREAAQRATSWGLFQLMGDSWKRCGFASVQAMVDAMHGPIGNHLDAFVRFIETDALLHAALRNHDWETFALRYNGKGYRVNKYHTKIGAAYDALAAARERKENG